MTFFVVLKSKLAKKKKFATKNTDPGSGIGNFFKIFILAWWYEAGKTIAPYF